jgi:hypothetical protein
MKSAVELRLVRSGNLFDPTFGAARARQEDFQDPGAVVSRDWLQSALEHTREALNTWSVLWGPVVSVPSEWIYGDNPLAPVVAGLDAAIAECRSCTVPIWLRREKVLELVRSLVRQVAVRGPEPQG